MALQASIRVRGLPRLRKGLEALQKPESDEILSEGLLAGARLVKRAVQRQLSGQVLNVRSGRLRDGIDVDPFGLPRRVAVGSEEEYAPPHEYGWPGKNLPPRRFFERGLDAVEEQLAEAYLEAVDRALAKAGWKPR
jgi:phage gpG-like protein